MKNTIKLLGGALVAAVILFTSCGGEATPKSVAEKFVVAIEDKKFEEAEKLATPESKQVIDMLKGFSNMMPDSAKTKKEFEFGEEKVEGDKATVSYKVKGSDKNQTVNLVKKDGKWLVAMSKADMGGGSQDAAAAPATTEEPAAPAAETTAPADAAAPAATEAK